MKKICDIRNSSVPTTSRPKANQERGASMVEYALLVALIAAISIAGVKVLGNASSTRFSTAASAVR